MKYLKKFNNAGALNEWVASDAHLLPNVVIVDGELAYNISPLYIEALEDDMAVSFSHTIEYKMEGGEWTALPASTATPSIAKGGRVYFRASGITPTDTAGIGTFTITKQCNVGGNIMSMVHGAEFYGQTAMTEYQFRSLFINAVAIVDAENLVLPATTLSGHCYRSMFNGCSNLVHAPSLPATTLADNCYDNMFNRCSNLVHAPSLPATTLATYCYRSMFSGCTSLVNAPELPATTLATYCYGSMFSGCTSLVNAPELPATTLATSCYSFMFKNCTKLNYIKAMFTTTPGTSYTSDWLSGVATTGTFVKNAAATWDVTGVSGIPTGWTVETAEA